MTFIPDNSPNGNQLDLSGNSKLSIGSLEKEVNFKGVLQPINDFDNQLYNRFGEAVAYDSDYAFVGSPGNRYTAQLSGTATNAGAVFIFKKQKKTIGKTRQTRVRHRQVFNYTGELQDLTIPQTVERITIQLIGAGGGGNTLGTHKGGDGAYVKASLLVEGGMTYKVMVGQGGVAGGTTNAFGGGGKLAEANGRGGSGGGRSALLHPVFGDIITAGAGGGAGVDGPGGNGGIIGGNGTSNKTVTHPFEDYSLDAQGANGYVQGFNLAFRTDKYQVFGTTYDLNTSIGTNDAYFDTKHMGGDAIKQTQIAGDFENGAGGGGFAGGAAGPDAYGYRENTSVAWTYYKLGGSGSGGSSMVEPPLAAMFRNDQPMVKNVVTRNGGDYQLSDELNDFGHGGIGMTAGENGTVIVEWEEIVEGEVEPVETWEWVQDSKVFATSSGSGSFSRRANAFFGSALAASGQWLVVGVPGDSLGTSSNSTTFLENSGAIHIFRLVNGVWTNHQRLIASGTNGRNAGDMFGSSVAIVGNKIFVGAPGHSFNAQGAGEVAGAGAVFVFTLNGTSWTQSGKIVANGLNARTENSNFGYKIDGNDSTLIVASKNGYDSTGSNELANAGSVFVFNATNNIQEARFAPDRTVDANFGSALSVNDNVISIESSGTSTQFIYRKPVSTWILEKTIQDSGSDLVIYNPMQNNGVSVANSVTGFNSTYLSHNVIAGTNGSSADTNYYRDSQIDRGIIASGFNMRNADNQGVRVTMPAFFDLPTFTLEHWINVVNPMPTGQQILAKTPANIVRRGTNWEILLERSNGSTSGGYLYLKVDNNGNPKRFDFGMIDRYIWTHFAVVKDGNNLSLFVNGELRNTYDVSDVTFVDTATVVSWGYDAGQPGAYRCPQFVARDFTVRSSAVYKASYTPSTAVFNTSNSVYPLGRNTFGRGTSTLVIDSTTIFSGLPRGYVDNPVKTTESNFNDESKIQYQNKQALYGKIDMLYFTGEDWLDDYPSFFDGGHQYSRQGGEFFGSQVYIDRNVLLVGSHGDVRNKSGGFDSTNPGSVWVFSVPENMKLIDKLKREAPSAGAYGQFKLSGSVQHKLVDASYAVRNTLFFEYIGRTSNNTPTMFRKAITHDRAGHVTSFVPTSYTVSRNNLYLWSRLTTNQAWRTANLSSFDSTQNVISFNTPAAAPAYNTFASNLAEDINGSIYEGLPDATRTDPTWITSSSGNIVGYSLDTLTGNYVGTQAANFPGSSISSSRAGNYFGFTVKTDGTNIYASEPGSSADNTSNNATGSNRGMIYQYNYKPQLGGWDITREFTPNTRVANGYFGISFDIADGYLVAKARNTDNSAYVFELDDTTFNQLNKISISESNSLAGSTSIGFLGDTLNIAVGTDAYALGGKSNVGSVSIITNTDPTTFTLTDSNLIPSFPVDDRNIYAKVGWSVSMGVDNFVFGAPGYNKINDGQSIRTDVGAGFHYTKSGSKWKFNSRVANDSNTSNALMGNIVLKGDTVVLSTTSSASTADIFKLNGSKYEFNAKVTNSSGGSNYAAILAGDRIVLGQPLRNHPNTSLLVAGGWTDYAYNGTNWVKGINWYTPLLTNGAYEQGTINYNSFNNLTLARNAGDEFGASLALNADKTMLVIGAPSHRYRVDSYSQSAGTNFGGIFAYYFDTTTNTFRLNTKISEPSNYSSTRYGQTIRYTSGNSFVTGYRLGNGVITRGTINRITSSATNISATWSSTFEIDNASSQDLFGSSFAYDSLRDILMVGVPGATITGVDSGAFETITSTQTRTRFTIPGEINNRATNNYFGSAVDFDGTTLAVGSYGFRYNQDGIDQGSQYGGVFVFDKSDEDLFEPKQKITFSTQASSSQFGSYVSVSDEQLVVYGRNSRPVILNKDNDGLYTSPVTSTVPNQYVTDAVDIINQITWDKQNKKSIVTRTANNFGANIVYPNDYSASAGIGLAASVDTEANTFDFDQFVTPVTIGTTGIVEAPHFLNSATFGFSKNMVLSPDASMLAVAAPTDNYYLGVLNTFNNFGSVFLGKVYIYQWNATLARFEYHSFIVNPMITQSWSNITLSWKEEKLLISSPDSSQHFVFKYQGNQRWMVDSTVTFERTGSNAQLMLDGDTLVLTRPTSDGTPILSQSGAAKVMKLNDGVWGSYRGKQAGANATPHPIVTTRAIGGGGAGFVGGKAATTDVTRSSALGGSNLVPVGGTQILSNSFARANPTNPLALGGGADLPGTDGEDARIVVRYLGEEVVMDFTGYDQEFEVPAGVTELEVLLWGAGGGSANFPGSVWSNLNTGRGGAGAFVSATLAVTPGETLTFMVGAGGAGGVTDPVETSIRLNERYGLGGYGSIPRGDSTYSGGGGGGLAAIKRGDEYLVIAGGGGGGSTSNSVATRADGMPGGYNVPQDFGISLAFESDGQYVVAPGIVNSRSAGDLFGYKVGLTEDGIVLVGAPQHEFDYSGNKMKTNSGVIFEYKKVNGKWQVLDKILSSSSKLSESMGVSFTVTENGLITLGSIPVTSINSTYASLISNVSTPTIEKFERVGDRYISLAKSNLPGNSSNLSVSVASVGDLIVLGNPRMSSTGATGSLTNSGGFSTFKVNEPFIELDGRNSLANTVNGRYANDFFGTALAFDGTQLFIGAPGHDYTGVSDTTRVNQGAIFAYEKVGNRFRYADKLSFESDSTRLGLGSKLTLVGDRLYAGSSNTNHVAEFVKTEGVWSIAKHIETTANTIAQVLSQAKVMELAPTSNIGTNGQPNVTSAGRASTFSFDAAGVLTNDNADYTIPGGSNGRNAFDRFGYSVYANHDFVVVGAPGHNRDTLGNTGVATGALFVFNKAGAEWEKETKITLDSTNPVGLGSSLSGRNGWVISGGLDGTSGVAKVFQRVAEGQWVERYSATGTGTSGDSMGYSVAAADTNKFVVGLPTSNGVNNDVADSGIARVFERTGTTWNERAAISSNGMGGERNEGDWFGYHIASNSKYLVIGSPNFDFDNQGANQLANSGVVWVYTKQGDYPTAAKIVSPSRVENGQFGFTVGIDEETNRIAVGEPGANKVHIFNFDGANAVLDQTITTTLDAGETFGQTIAFNGGILMVGSKNAQTDALSENPLVDSGAVYIWRRDNSLATWSLVEKIAGFYDANDDLMTNGRNAGDLFGSSVAIDETGSAIIGSPGHDWDIDGANSVDNAGAVYLKKLK